LRLEAVLPEAAFGLVATLPAAVFLAVLGADFAGVFLSALRALAGAAALARAVMDDFDFAAIFLDFATALAMTANNPTEREDTRLTPRLGGSAQGAKPAPRYM
jgi:hypothetical protein